MKFGRGKPAVQMTQKLSYDSDDFDRVSDQHKISELSSSGVGSRNLYADRVRLLGDVVIEAALFGPPEYPRTKSGRWGRADTASRLGTTFPPGTCDLHRVYATAFTIGNRLLSFSITSTVLHQGEIWRD